jgi:protein-S-isoprenylcysteine O-methyltransferase Ste14
MAATDEAGGNRPGVRIPPPLVFVAALVTGWLVDRAIPGPRPEWLQSLPTAIGAIAMIIAGGALSFSGVLAFWRARTTILPFQEASRFVVAGPYRFTRNPMYVGLAAVSLGVALILRALWAVPFVLVACLFLDRFVIRAEEAHLEARFGDDFRGYRRRVRRWL